MTRRAALDVQATRLGRLGEAARSGGLFGTEEFDPAVEELSPDCDEGAQVGVGGQLRTGPIALQFRLLRGGEQNDRVAVCRPALSRSKLDR
jgi:hypothetical protein